MVNGDDPMAYLILITKRPLEVGTSTKLLSCETPSLQWACSYSSCQVCVSGMVINIDVLQA